jgi:hypothetical protein
MVTLRNRTPVVQVYNLSHEHACGGSASQVSRRAQRLSGLTPDEQPAVCRCRSIDLPILVRDPVTGRNGIRTESRSVSRSLRFRPNESLQVDERVLECPEVKAAFTRKPAELVVVAAAQA